MFKNNSGFEYILHVDPSEQWRADFPWDFIRIRSIVITSVSQYVGSFLAFSRLDQIAWSILLLVTGTGSGLWLLWVRSSRLKKFNSEEVVHRLTHELRESVQAIKTATDMGVKRIRTEQFYKELAENIAEYFRERNGNRTINCVLRLASIEGEMKVYHTMARSSGLAEERRVRSQSEPSNCGIAKRFLEHNAQGAYLIFDRIGAAKNDVWNLSNNDALGDVNMILSVPVNGYDGTDFGMLGVLHLTARTGKLSRGDWAPLKALADLLGHTLPIVYSPSSVTND